MRVGGVIIGSGIIGSALAYALVKKGVRDVHVVDPDLMGALSSTERNAGGVRHLWQQPINVELARHSISYFESIKKEIGFHQSGYLWLFKPESQDDGTKLLEHTRRMGLSYELLDVAEIRKRYPFIDKTDDLGFAILGTKDGLLNSNAVKAHFREKAKEGGAVFHDRTWVKKVQSKDGKTQLELVRVGSEAEAEKLLKSPELTATLAGSETWNADFVALTAGAWTKGLLESISVEPRIQPIRRQISVFKSETLNLSDYGMIVDTSRVYFHPEAGNIIAGFVLKEEKPAFRFDYDADFFESHIWPNLYERSSGFENLKEITGLGGLYSYTEDISGILGAVPGHPGVFEAHSFTGHGVMQSYGAGVALAELIVDGKFSTIDASVLTRERFKTRALIPENLHI